MTSAKTLHTVHTKLFLIPPKEIGYVKSGVFFSYIDSTLGGHIGKDCTLDIYNTSLLIH